MSYIIIINIILIVIIVSNVCDSKGIIKSKCSSSL